MNKPESTSTGSMAGCTATVVIVTNSEIYCCNAGDSRTVLSKGKNALPLSRDHKPDEPGEKRRIYHAKSFVEDNRVEGMLGLSRALGDFEYKSNKTLKPKEQAVTAFPEIQTSAMTADTEFLILACDGIWDVMNN